MPIRSEWKLAREGVTADTVVRFLRGTVLNPALTIPLFLLARFTQKGRLLASDHGSLFKYLRTALALGAMSRVSEFFDDAVTNNWTNDVYDWNKEVVVVTGGSDGIGKLVVQLLAERGVKVAVLDVQELTYEAPPSVRYFHVDLASPTSIAHAAAEVKSHFGNPTILINNAGCARGKSILASTESDIRLTFNVNTLSHYFLTQQFLPSMISHNHGMVVTVSSYAAYVTAQNMVDYAASKAAALSFHEGLSAELVTEYKAPRIRTVIMCQSYTRTKLFQGFHGSALYAETVAEEIVKAVLAGKSRHILTPEVGWLVAARLRSMPLWFQYGLRKGLDRLMRRWQGRQVVQPSLAEEGEEEEDKGPGDSTVLVDKE